jgi:hypothetical protein
MLRVLDYDWDYGDIGGGEVGCTDLKVFGMYDRGELHKVGNFILLNFSIDDESEVRKSLVMN